MLLLACLVSCTLLAQEAMVSQLMSKDLAQFPGKEAVMITVVCPPGAADAVAGLIFTHQIALLTNQGKGTFQGAFLACGVEATGMLALLTSISMASWTS